MRPYVDRKRIQCIYFARGYCGRANCKFGHFYSSSDSEDERSRPRSRSPTRRTQSPLNLFRRSRSPLSRRTSSPIRISRSPNRIYRSPIPMNRSPNRIYRSLSNSSLRSDKTSRSLFALRTDRTQTAIHHSRSSFSPSHHNSRNLSSRLSYRRSRSSSRNSVRLISSVRSSSPFGSRLVRRSPSSSPFGSRLARRSPSSSPFGSRLVRRSPSSPPFVSRLPRLSPSSSPDRRSKRSEDEFVDRYVRKDEEECEFRFETTRYESTYQPAYDVSSSKTFEKQVNADKKVDQFYESNTNRFNKTASNIFDKNIEAFSLLGDVPDEIKRSFQTFLWQKELSLYTLYLPDEDYRAKFAIQNELRIGQVEFDLYPNGFSLTDFNRDIIQKIEKWKELEFFELEPDLEYRCDDDELNQYQQYLIDKWIEEICETKQIISKEIAIQHDAMKSTDVLSNLINDEDKTNESNDVTPDKSSKDANKSTEMNSTTDKSTEKQSNNEVQNQPPSSSKQVDLEQGEIL